LPLIQIQSSHRHTQCVPFEMTATRWANYFEEILSKSSLADAIHSSF